MRPQSTSGYFPPPSSTPHHSTFSSFTTAHSSPTLASPSTLGSMSRGIGALSPQPHQSSIQAPPYPPRGYSYSTPIHHQMGGGSVLSNLSSPGSQVSLVGPGPMAPMGHGYPPSSLLSHHAMYHHPQQNPHQDRPFKCDVCTTAFNRNHDLKRHKKIHLAVKPFPCTFCDKSFSRKDALKRHRLVKGCGNGKTTPEGSHGQSPQDDIKRELGNRSDSYGTPGAIKAEPL
ncbi:hypothetical protein M426DRAFT_59520 [Hypoxylon sp. CI-4A]|nr:hypothetical protein M426DRAFT_59520 [Hypoxylon sp. CI-4A]